MNFLRQINMGSLAVIVSIVVAVGWIALDGTPPLIISIVGGGLIALKGTLDDDE